jgi:SAM-dependent methyltransferase
MLAVGARRHRGPLVRADATALPFADGSLAAVYGVWVFHVVDDAGAVLAECHRALRPGGRVLAVVTDETRRVGHPLLDRLEQRYRRRNDTIDHLDPLAAAVGLRRRLVEPLAPFRRPTAPAELAHHLERRTWSWLWAVPPDAWAAEVEPVIAALRAEADPDVPRPHQNANLLAVWER